MTLRARRWYADDAAYGAQQTIAINAVLPYNAELLQWSIAFSNVPTTSESLIITRDNVRGPLWDVDIVTWDPSIAGVLNFQCNEIWQFAKGDAIVVTYANTDDYGVGFEVVFREAF